ncbi:hypothetical protein [Aurantimicrobium minutum]|uniref:Uncharacterized protein n=1 Tax=Aurantimicrobium minutum TaxID=708131 RepID=A0A173LVC4_9MICO|nr:hypothetical protein [Aurantimicrobium minutum]BAU98822.1 Uncharacterized protein AUMI_12800 [Aurantimicrobium minutum]
MRLLPVLAISIASLTLVGCSTTTPEAIPTSSAVEQAPAFASDEEALAAAQAAYAEYLSVSDQIARDGGANPERLKPYVTNDQFQLDQQNIAKFRDLGFHSEGVSTFDNFHVANSDVNTYSAYLCVDVSNSKLIDSSGNTVTPEGREDRWPLLVSFDFSNPGSVLIKGSETWAGKNFC